MKLLIINGSPRKTGRTRLAVKSISEKYSMESIDLSEVVLPLFNGDVSQKQDLAVLKLQNAVKSADGIIFASPEYHGAMSGALKNALDFLGSEYFANKPVSLIAVAGGGKGGINALNNMRTTGRSLYANVLPKQIVLDPTDFDYYNQQLVNDALDNIDRLMTELKMYTDFFLLQEEKEEVQ
ncbi:NADPH-dependent FMN reductase [Peribacillus alkalitolerans]|uniref:NADPH-dependent FMN reductase n=1 Tax=Peribacillus alkalitolerans TaxID=1550385 RepID=UPI0013D19CFD|nr:NADPH-dependent FMN reductase [Peribacillus alkalitolerans]